jgi:hypothetical protein
MLEYLKQFDYLWDGSSSGWLLVSDEEDQNHYSIFNEQTSVLLHIEDSLIHKAVCDRLLSLGVKVLDHIPPTEFNIENLNIQE